MAGIITIEVGKWGELGTLPEATLRRLNDETHFPAVEELIAYFGGDSWLREYKGMIAAQGGTITYIFQVNESPTRSAQILAQKMQEVFDKRWARVTSPYRTEGSKETVEARKRAEEQRAKEAEQRRRDDDERKAAAERQRREKEEAEAKVRAAEARKSALQAERNTHRQCIMCGKPLSLFQRLFTSDTQHKQCSHFTE